jgi:L-aminoadipate-semialdehyde dehydrogenase
LAQKYIDEELSIKTQIPDLRLSNAGLLSGGEKEGRDIFASV